jgi:hypothetical protein
MPAIKIAINICVPRNVLSAKVTVAIETQYQQDTKPITKSSY